MYRQKEADPVTQTQRNAAIQRKLRVYTEVNTRSKTVANAALVREGFVLKNGKAAPAFADEERETAHS